MHFLIYIQKNGVFLWKLWYNIDVKKIYESIGRVKMSKIELIKVKDYKELSEVAGKVC
jgi:hypothetical protein